MEVECNENWIIPWLCWGAQRNSSMDTSNGTTIKMFYVSNWFSKFLVDITFNSFGLYEKELLMRWPKTPWVDVFPMEALSWEIWLRSPSFSYLNVLLIMLVKLWNLLASRAWGSMTCSGNWRYTSLFHLDIFSLKDVSHWWLLWYNHIMIDLYNLCHIWFMIYQISVSLMSYLIRLYLEWKHWFYVSLYC